MFSAHSNRHGDEALLAEGRVAAGSYFVIRGDGADGSCSFGDRRFFNMVLKKIYFRSFVNVAVPVAVDDSGAVSDELLTDKATNCSPRVGVRKQKSHFTPSHVLSVVSGRVAGQIFPDPAEAVWAR